MSAKKVFKKRATEQQLRQALEDAARPGLSPEEASLIELRIKTLSKLVEQRKSAKLERLSAELVTARKEIERLTGELQAATSNVPAKNDIQQALERYRAERQTNEGI